MKRFDKHTVRALGFALIVIGILLFIFGLLAPPDTSALAPCPYPGCLLPWDWWIPRASLVSGIGLIIAGMILLILARRMKPKPKTDAAEGYQKRMLGRELAREKLREQALFA